MAKELADLIRDPIARDRLGRAAAEKVVARHDLREAAPRILGIMQRTASVRRGSA
jgi:hypothetical protein